LDSLWPSPDIASFRHPDRDHFVAVPPINSEISIQCEHFGCAVDLRESNQTGVGHGHRPIAIPPHERPKIRLLFLNSERDPNDLSL
jgi:hypothetical protein